MSTAYFYGGEWHNPAKSSPSMDFRSRIHRYGDGFFESAIYFNGAIRHVHHHVERIKQSLTLLKMPTLPVSIDEIMQLITEKINDEKWSSARIRLSFFREAEGFYMPKHARTEYFIELQQAETQGYQLNETGLTLGNYKELTKNENYLSLLKTQSSLLYVMAGIFAQENNWDEAVIFNEKGRISECISSNIFALIGDFIVTPPLSEYCVNGVMRKVVIQAAKTYGYEVQERPISEIELNSASEIFLTNATKGIQWVMSYNGKPLLNGTAKVLSTKID